jgi:hypothetical protein
MRVTLEEPSFFFLLEVSGQRSSKDPFELIFSDGARKQFVMEHTLSDVRTNVSLW